MMRDLSRQQRWRVHRHLYVRGGSVTEIVDVVAEGRLLPLAVGAHDLELPEVPDRLIIKVLVHLRGVLQIPNC